MSSMRASPLLGGESLAGLSIMAPRVIPVGHEQMVGIVYHHRLGVQMLGHEFVEQVIKCPVFNWLRSREGYLPFCGAQNIGHWNCTCKALRD